MILSIFFFLEWESPRSQPGVAFVSLCVLYQEDRCHAGTKCNQIHVRRAHMRHVHAAVRVLRADLCCPHHNDEPMMDSSTSFDEIGQVLRQYTVQLAVCRASTAETVQVPWERMAYTKVWASFLPVRGDTFGTGHAAKKKTCPVPAWITIPFARVCGPHLQQCCGWGLECRNLHLCREYYQREVKSRRHSSSSEDDKKANKDDSLPRESRLHLYWRCGTAA